MWPFKRWRLSMIILILTHLMREVRKKIGNEVIHKTQDYHEIIDNSVAYGSNPLGKSREDETLELDSLKLVLQPWSGEARGDHKGTQTRRFELMHPPWHWNCEDITRGEGRMQHKSSKLRLVLSSVQLAVLKPIHLLRIVSN